MSTPIQNYEVRRFYQDPKGVLNIDENGMSPQYPGSRFSVIEHSPSIIYDGKSSYSTGKKWDACPVPLEDLEIPLNKTVRLTGQQVSALEIRENGLSSRKDLSQYKFEVFSTRNGSVFSYWITKREK